VNEIEPETTSLIVIDMLNDFVEERGSLIVPNAKNLIPNQKQLLKRFRDNNSLIVYLTDNHLPDDDEFDKWPPHAIRGTWGAEVVEELTPKEGEIIIPKRRYSGFFGTELDLILRERGIKTVILMGVLTDICIMYTSADASARGYNVLVVTDGTRSIDTKNHKFALNHMKEVHGSLIVSTKEVLQML
jgi:nicotinamidase-related amidase